MINESFNAGSNLKLNDYEVFIPSNINKSFVWKDKEINMLLEKATLHLGELNVYSKLVPDIDFFIHMHELKEATNSSSIEGTVTTIDEAVLSECEIDINRRNDWQEVQNYTNAMNYAINELKQTPLSIRLLKNTHQLLLKGVRGDIKDPGNIRNVQVRIGGSNYQTALFVPPPPNMLPDLLTDLEKFWHNEDIYVPNLIKIALSHYQFEAIHPFLDGNGRIGRLLITLYLIEKGMLNKPSLYLSDYFESNRKLYYDSLNLVSSSNNIDQWIKFFLRGIIETSLKGKSTLERIVFLRNLYEEKLAVMGKSKSENGKKLLQLLYSKPIINIKYVEVELKLTTPTVNTLVREFERIGILKEITKNKRNRSFVFSDYLELFRK